MNTEWKKIDESEIYPIIINRDGCVRQFETATNSYVPKSTIRNNIGALLISITKAKCKSKVYMVSKLVAKYFLPIDPSMREDLELSTGTGTWFDKISVRHINGDKTDCRVDNLEWIYPKVPYIQKYQGEDERWVEYSVDGEDYHIGSLGNIKIKNSDGVYRYERRYEYGNKYLYIFTSNNSIRKNISIHRLVCMAFNSLDDRGLSLDNYDDLEVNHLNGNKQDNRASNLEWVSKQDNVRHAFQNRLNATSNHVKVKDLVADTENVYYSFNHLAEALELGTQEAAKLICYRHTDKPYKGRYLFEITETYRTKKHYRQGSYLVYDYVTRQASIYSTLNEVEKVTGIVINSLIKRFRSEVLIRKPINSYEIFDLDRYERGQFPEWLNVSKEEALETRERYLRMKEHGVSSGSREVEVLDVLTGDVRTYPAMKIACRVLGMDYLKWKQIMYRYKDTCSPLRQVGNYVLRYSDTHKPWEPRIAA
jgi:hypothetical protein